MEKATRGCPQPSPTGKGDRREAVVDEGPYARERSVYCVFLAAPAHNAPPQSRLRRASSTFYGIAATGSYVRFNSLRDAPPGGEALFYRSDP